MNTRACSGESVCETARQTDRRSGRQVGRQADRQTDRQTDGERERESRGGKKTVPADTDLLTFLTADNRQEMAGKTSCYRGNNSAAFTPSGNS